MIRRPPPWSPSCLRPDNSGSTPRQPRAHITAAHITAAHVTAAQAHTAALPTLRAPSKAGAATAIPGRGALPGSISTESEPTGHEDGCEARPGCHDRHWQSLFDGGARGRAAARHQPAGSALLMCGPIAAAVLVQLTSETSIACASETAGKRAWERCARAGLVRSSVSSERCWSRLAQHNGRLSRPFPPFTSPACQTLVDPDAKTDCAQQVRTHARW